MSNLNWSRSEPMPTFRPTGPFSVSTHPRSASLLLIAPISQFRKRNRSYCLATRNRRLAERRVRSRSFQQSVRSVDGNVVEATLPPEWPFPLGGYSGGAAAIWDKRAARFTVFAIGATSSLRTQSFLSSSFDEHFVTLVRGESTPSPTSEVSVSHGAVFQRKTALLFRFVLAPAIQSSITEPV